MTTLHNIEVTTCYACASNGKSVRLNAEYDDNGQLVSLVCSNCGAVVPRVERGTKRYLEEVLKARQAQEELRRKASER